MTANEKADAAAELLAAVMERLAREAARDEQVAS